MARGRMINSSICRDKKVNELSNDTCRLAFTWLITYADREGRTDGDPAVVRSLLFPRRADVTVAEVEGYLQEMADLELIKWYEADGDRWIWFPAFERNQKGLDQRKETVSRIPKYVLGTEVVRTEYVPGPTSQEAELASDKGNGGTGQVRTEYVPSTAEEKRKEKKRNEEKRASAAAAEPQAAKVTTVTGEPLPPADGEAFSLYVDTHCDNFNPIAVEELRDLVQDYSDAWVSEAIREAVRSDVPSPSINYLKAVLTRWRRDGFKTPRRKNGQAQTPDSDKGKKLRTEYLEDWTGLGQAIADKMYAPKVIRS